MIGSCYIKLIEEKELQLRYGLEYEEYKKSRPFLLPSFDSRVWAIACEKQNQAVADLL